MNRIKLFFTALAILCSAAIASAQNVALRGVVKDSASGEGVPGAAVQLKGSTTAYALSDALGSYEISVPANGTLVVSCLGYETVEVEVAGRNVVDIVLNPASQQLDDVIVVAFGTATKESFTGSAKVVDSEALATSQVSNAVQALNGKVAGVQMSSSTGSPADDGTTIRIRGFSSINAGQAPLIVLDGIPYDGSMNNINPADVESMTVLKDAASNALYGARGANGVIMITTKKAKSRDAIVNFDAKVGINSRAVPDYNYIKSVPGYYEMQYKALYNYYVSQGADAQTAHDKANNNVAGPAANGGLVYQVYSVPEGQYFIGMDGKVNPNATLGNVVGGNYLTPDDWTSEVLNNSIRQEYNLSVMGGSDKSSFYTSFGYLNNKGILEKTDYDRFSGRIKADYQAKKWLKVGANAAFTHSAGRYSEEDGVSNSSANVFALTTQMAPIYPLYIRDAQGNILTDSNGYTVYDYGNKSNGGLERPFFTGTNAVGDHYLNENNTNGSAINATAFADITFLKDFKFTVNAGTSMAESRSTYLTNAFYGTYASSNGILSKYHTRSLAYNLQEILNWGHTFGPARVDIMVGHENYSRDYAYLYASRSNMFSPENLELAGAIKESGSNSYVTNYNTEGYFTRAQFNLLEKVFLSASYRRDASSRFAPENRWGNFWSVGGAWIISKENWFNVEGLDLLKFKASYGSQGNDAIGNYLYTDTYDIQNAAGAVSLVLDTKGNRNITWETNGNFNAGVEFDLYDGLVGGSVEGFYRKTTDMLSWFTVPPSLGYSGYWANVGDMVNKGLEFEVEATPIRTKNVVWSVNANATIFKNEITKLAESRKTMTTSEGYKGYQSGGYFYGEGLSLYTFYEKQYAGVDQSTGAPMWYQDVTVGDQVVKVPTTNYTNATYYCCGDPIPDAYGGFGTTLQAYGFDLALNFTYQIGGLVYDSGYATAMGSPTSNNLGQNFHADLLNAWTPENTNTDIPRWQYNDQYNASSCNRFLTNASYLNLQNVNFGYTIPRNVTKTFGVDKLRVYLACENVWLWSARQGLDPRLSLTGSNNATTYSAIRTISGGLNLTF